MKLLSSIHSLHGSIQQIIQYTDSELYIVTAYAQLTKGDDEWKSIVKALSTLKNEKKCSIYFFLREPQKEKVIEELKPFATEIWLVPNLHAKCYYNGKTALVTSLNFLYHSVQNNFELGIEIPSKKTNELAMIAEYIKELKRHGKEILKQEQTKEKESHIQVFIDPSDNFEFYSPEKGKLGFCVKCGKKVEYLDIEMHMIRCYSCYKKYRFNDIAIEFCHCCGEPYKHRDLTKPFCLFCYVQIKDSLVYDMSLFDYEKKK